MIYNRAAVPADNFSRCVEEEKYKSTITAIAI
jgi:hypothetical protein